MDNRGDGDAQMSSWCCNNCVKFMLPEVDIDGWMLVKNKECLALKKKSFSLSP